MVTGAAPSREEALRLFRERFLNRTDYVAVLAPWEKPCPVEANGTLDTLLLGHLFGSSAPEAKVRYSNKRGSGAMKGWFRIGAYCPGLDDTTRWLCIDFDGAGHAGQLENPLAAAKTAHDAFTEAGLPVFLERSGGGKGWHLWCFFDPPLPAAKAQALGHALAPKDAPLITGEIADPKSGRGIEVFPKQEKVRKKGKKGFGNLVWLPWWHGAAEGSSVFYRFAADGKLEAYVPSELAVASLEVVDKVLGASVGQTTGSPAKAPARTAAGPTQPAALAANSPTDPAWSEWRKRALAALPLEQVYGDLLTGNAHGEGWLECRDPSSPTGDQNPSASVADGTGEAERGTFHSFISGQTVSVFDFLVEQRVATDFKEARTRVAKISDVAEPRSGPPPLPTDGSWDPPASPRRPEIQINGRPLDAQIIEAWAAVRASNRKRPVIFRRGPQVVRLINGHDGPRIEGMTESAVYGHLARISYWVRVTENAVIQTSPNKDIARDMLDYPDEHLPVLEAVVNTPVLDKDGQLVSASGYSTAAHLWYHPPIGFNVARVPPRPSTEDVAAAKVLLLEDLLGDFPFADESCKAHMLAALLLPFARRLIDGSTPIHLIEAPTEGSGKGLLVDIIAILTTGSEAAGGSLPDNEEEIRKKIGAELSTGQPLLVLDNADNKRRLDSSALASAVTMRIWRDRLLGQTKVFEVPNEVVWVLTGNNPRLSRELARRCISIRIDPRTDRPWLRTNFRHRPLQGWAKENRGALVRAALVLIQNWLAQGQRPGDILFGSFDVWAKTMGGILCAAGVPGFLQNLEKLYETADAEGTMWREFVDGWWELHQDRRVRVSQLVELCNQSDFMAPVLGDGSEKSQATRLGKALQNARDRVFGHHRIESGGRDSDSKRPVYRLVKNDTGQLSLET